MWNGSVDLIQFINKLKSKMPFAEQIKYHRPKQKAAIKAQEFNFGIHGVFGAVWVNHYLQFDGVKVYTGLEILHGYDAVHH